MTRLSPGLYATWREASAAFAALRETVDPPSERLLQLVWMHQRIVREGLVTTDGQALRVLHPGFWNREAGPDFRGAVVQVGPDAALTGDVEIDLTPPGWRAHGHATNPTYARVVLHVVWDARGGPTFPVPTLALRGRLDAPVPELADWAVSGQTGLPPAMAGRCRTALRALEDKVVAELLDQAAQERLRHKADVLRARARRAGWEQALWEGLFGALGYKHNPWPMRRIAELLPQMRAAGPLTPDGATHWEARLLGVASLLPVEARGETGDHVRRLWDLWWREREALADGLLPRSMWRLSGGRPANHPQRRLVLAARWLAWGDLVSRLERWWAEAPATNQPAHRLLEVLQPPPDRLWSHRWTLRSAAARGPCPLLGAARVTDLAVNVILPWLHARASAGRQAETVARVEQVYFAWPAGEDNAVLRQARSRLFGPAWKGTPSAAAQQGLLQIVRDFCDHTNALCDGCRLPGLVEITGSPDRPCPASRTCIQGGA